MFVPTHPHRLRALVRTRTGMAAMLATVLLLVLAAVLPPVAGAINFTTGQNSDMLIGATAYTERSMGASAAAGMDEPTDVAVDGSGSVYVTDRNMNRVLRWGTRPTVNGQAPSTYLWKASVANGATPDVRWSWAYGPIDKGSNNPQTLAVAGDGATFRMMVGDAYDRRVVLLTKDEATLANSDFGTAAFGQVDLFSNGTGAAADQLSDASGTWTDGTNSIVGDTSNHRVLIYTSFPTTNGSHPAAIVLGQPAMGGTGNTCPNDTWNGSSCGGPSTPSATTMNNPTDVFYDGSYLYVADRNNNRVLVWIAPTLGSLTNGKAADYVLGQSTFSGTTASGSANGLSNPNDIAVKGTGAGRRIAIASENSNRVVIFNGTPSTGASANDVLGQPAATGANAQPNRGQATATADSLRSPTGLAYDPVTGDLYIADSLNHRVVRYPSASQTTGSSADLVLGHAGAGAMTTTVPLDAVSENHFTTQTLGAYNIFGPKLAYTPTGRLLESSYDEGAMRIWNTPTTVNAAYDYRFGQSARTNAGGNGPGQQATSALRVRQPGPLWSDGTRVLLTDSSNNRVLVWNHMPTSDGDAPDFVLGQSGFTGGAGGTATNQMAAPGGVTSDGVDVYVADSNNHRVLVFRNYWAAPTNQPTATVVLGSGVAGTSSADLNYPRGLGILQDQLVVADRNNHRVVVWNDIQNVTTGTPIDAVIGQSSFTARAQSTITWYVESVATAGGGVMWGAASGAKLLDPIPRSGFVTAGASSIGVDTGVTYHPTPTQSNTAFPTGLTAAAGKVWLANAGFGRLQRWSDVTTPVPSGLPTATVSCDGTVVIAQAADESTSMTVRYGPASLGSWGAGYPQSTVDTFPYTAQPRYEGPTHQTTLNFATAGTYYARVQVADWAGNAATPSAEISFTVPPTCPAPTTMFGSDVNAQVGVANPAGATAIKTLNFRTSWQNVAGVTMDRHQAQTWTTPPEQAAGVWHLDGALAGDSNGSATGAGTWTGSATYASDGRFGQAASTTSGRFVTVPHAAALSRANDLSAEAWFRTPTIAGGAAYQVLFAKTYIGCGPTTNCNYGIEFHRATNELCAIVAGVDGVEYKACTSAAGLAATGWHHAALTLTSSRQLRLYVDGAPAAGPTAMPVDAITSSDPLFIGASSSAGVDPFAGDIDEVRVVPRALTAGEVLGNYRTRRPNLVVLHDSGTGGGSGRALGSDCATATRCPDQVYGAFTAGQSDILRAGARYYTRVRLHTKKNDYWSAWANDWFETDSTTSITVTVNPIVTLGSFAPGTNVFGSSTIQVTTDDAGGYQLLARDTSNAIGMTGSPSGAVPDFQTPGAVPAAWPAASALGIGFTIRSAPGGRLPKWGAAGPFPESDVTNNLYAALGTTDTLLHQRLTYDPTAEPIVMTTRVNAPPTTPSGSYTGSVTLTALANP